MPPSVEHPRSGAVRASTRLRIGDFRLREVGIARYDLRDPYYAAVTAPWYAVALSALALVLLLNLGFAVLYLLRPDAVQNLPAGSLADAFFFSVETMSTVGYGAMAPASFYGHVVATTEVLLGLGFTASLTGILFVRLSRPRARILFADRLAVNGTGDRVLSVRVANGRQVPLLDATADLSAVLLVPGADGAPSWQLHHLPLQEERIGLFPPVLDPAPPPGSVESARRLRYRRSSSRTGSGCSWPSPPTIRPSAPTCGRCASTSRTPSPSTAATRSRSPPTPMAASWPT